MKRLIVFILVSFLLCGLGYFQLLDFNIETLFDKAYVEVYTSKESEVNGFSKIKNGVGEIIFLNIDKLEYILNCVDECGYTIRIYEKNVQEVVKALNMSKVVLKNGSIYGYKKGLHETVLIDGGRYNVQIAEGDGVVNVGVPILLGSY